MPIKRHGSNNWWLKKQTPSDIWNQRERLRAAGMKVHKVVWKSLGTANKQAALEHEVAQLSSLAERWKAWRAYLKDGPLDLSQRQVFAIVSDVLRETRAELEENPGAPSHVKAIVHHFGKMAQEPTDIFIRDLRDSFRTYLAERLKLRPVTDASLDALVAQALRDIPRALAMREAMALDGDYRNPQWLEARPSGKVVSGLEVTFEKLFASWQREALPKASTVRSYRTRVKFLTSRLGHEVASKVTESDLREWLEAMLIEHSQRKKPSRETIRDRLAAVNALLQWGTEHKLLAANVARDVKLRKRAREASSNTKRGFTEQEASKILSNARRMVGFLRWGPLIMGSTGMRVGEAAQLRKQDIVDEGRGNWHFRISPEAGNVKSNKERTAPLHPALKAEGFVAYVKDCKGERLFPEFFKKSPSPETVAQRASAKMRDWLRGPKGLGMQDLDLKPSHSWRHLFRTLTIEAGMDQDTRQSIAGWADSKSAQGYGEVTLKAQRKQLSKVKLPK